ncbi:hypothetical protein YC2023_093160 [Brassica napus]
MPRTIVSGRLSPAALPIGLSVSRLLSVKYAAQRLPVSVLISARVCSFAVETKSSVDYVVEKEKKKILACPICYNSLAALISQPHESAEYPASATHLQCKYCKKSYSANETHLDLTVASGTKQYTEPLPLSIELYRNPLVSFLYERGWRQNFMWGGFPGPEKEVTTFEMAKEHLKHVLGGNIIDASCGSGLFSRLFAKSEHFAMVYALDYSENMLRQFDAVHAGAALHCWPSPSSAVAEISRVLRPGGVFVATTFIYDGLFRFVPFLKKLRQEVMRYSGSHMFLSERELEDLCESCGLVGFTCVRNGLFIMLSATKPTR